jgi:hypothetical protein
MNQVPLGRNYFIWPLTPGQFAALGSGKIALVAEPTWRLE